MPRNLGPVLHLEDLTLEQRQAQPDRCQERWYRWLAARLAGMRVLDAGAGTGYGVEILRESGCVCEGFDPLPAGPLVRQARISDYPAESWDWVVALDVIEHVEADAAFLAELLRVARVGVILSTPNWIRWSCGNPYHVREYTPDELRALLAGLDVECWGLDVDEAEPRRLDPMRLDEPTAALGAVIYRESIDGSFRPRHYYPLLARAALGTGPLEDQLTRLMVWTGTYLQGSATHSEVYDPIEILIRRSAWCDQMTTVFLWLALRLLGLPGRMLVLRHTDGVSGHTAAEVYYSGGWHFYDPHPHYLQAYRIGGVVASYEQLRAHLELPAGNVTRWRGLDGRGLDGLFVLPPTIYRQTPNREPPEFVLETP